MMFQPISYFCSKRDACIDHYCYNYGMCISAMSGFPHVSLVSESRLAQHVLEVTELLFYGPILPTGPFLHLLSGTFVTPSGEDLLAGGGAIYLHFEKNHLVYPT